MYIYIYTYFVHADVYTVNMPPIRNYTLGLIRPTYNMLRVTQQPRFRISLHARATLVMKRLRLHR